MKLTPEARKAIEAAANGLEKTMDWLLANEPCGYYCDEVVGHVDHAHYNQARFVLHVLRTILETAEGSTLHYMDEWGIFKAVTD